MENVVFVHRGICCHCFIACPAHAHRFVPLLYVSCYMQLHELLAFFIYSDALMECVCGKQRAYHSMAPDTWAMCMSTGLPLNYRTYIKPSRFVLKD